MDQSSRTFRVFVIPQTFTDFTEERNALQREVFPKLRQLCEGTRLSIPSDRSSLGGARGGGA
jgi:hypothetical protein